MNCIIELGLENFPASSLQETLEALDAAFRKNFHYSNDISVKGTHRRMVIEIKDISISEKSAITNGPAEEIAFVDGKISRAGEMFLTKNGLTLKDSFVNEVNGKRYLAVKKEERVNVEESIAEALKVSLDSLNFQNSVVWNGIKFLRPIRYITALLDERVLAFRIGEVESSNFIKIRGEKILIDSYSGYFSALKEHGVIIDLTERAECVSDKVKRNRTFYEVINSVESPKAVICEFDRTFLSLPYQIIEETVASHQFGIMDSENRFFIICESHVEDKLVAKGNQRMVASRLSDAIFFVNEDRKKEIQHFVEQLKRITFNERLGSLFDKQLRLKKCAESMKLSRDAIEAAGILKFDLSSRILAEKEYADLRGYIGRIYALDRGIRDGVADLIFQHYLPRYQGDLFPTNEEAALLSIIDKTDNIVAAAILEALPTGAKDPNYIRRDAIGVISIIEKFGLNLKLSDLFKQSLSAYESAIEMKGYMDFMRSRVEHYLLQRFDKGIVNSVIEHFDDVNDVLRRAAALSKADFGSLKEIYKRAFNLSQTPLEGEIDRTILEREERELLDGIERVNLLKDYAALINEAIGLNNLIQQFFDKIIVMVANRKIRENRILILKRLVKALNLVGDLDRLFRG